jgi:kynurenine formamidase
MQNAIAEKRVKIDFEIDFSNGGGIQGQDFRLDIEGEDIADQVLSDFIVKDLRLPMVREVRILNKEIICEPHKRAAPESFETEAPNLVYTGWARKWKTEQYFEGHPFLTENAAVYLKEQSAVLVGIDSLNIDDISGGARPVHTTLLGADILIVEHLCNLDKLPLSDFTFTAVPVKVKGMGSFPVRPFASLRN